MSECRDQSKKVILTQWRVQTMASGGVNAISGDKDYKQKLRKRNESKKAIEIPNQQGSQDTKQDTEHQSDEEELKDMENSSGDSNTSNQSTQTVTLSEIPVVSMEDFKVVDMNDKLNLLMASINKINTNFHHHKFESLTKILSDEVEGVYP